MASTSSFEYGGNEVTATSECPSGYTENTAKTGCEKVDGDNTLKASYASSSITNGWTAKNSVKLNDCTMGEHWKISATIGGTDNNAGTVDYTSAALSSECEQLTPSFTKIAKAAAN